MEGGDYKKKYSVNLIDFQLTDGRDLHFINRYVITELMQSDLHKIIVSPQHLSTDHIKVFLYQILRGNQLVHEPCDVTNGLFLNFDDFFVVL